MILISCKTCKFGVGGNRDPRCQNCGNTPQKIFNFGEEIKFNSRTFGYHKWTPKNKKLKELVNEMYHLEEELFEI